MKRKKLLVLLILITLVLRVNAQSGLEVFTEENYGGTSQSYQIVTAHSDLGLFDNNIKSFKLKKGYMATFATNSDASGYSRVFVAQDQDLEVPVLPPYLNGTISFIRSMVWNDVTKKGWCGSGDAANDVAATNSTWRYNWDTGGTTTSTVEYVPMRHNLFWPSLSAANNNPGYTHFLGYNEPDRPDQANITVDQAIGGWPAFMENGLRLGSPSTSDPFNPWLAEFMTKADNLGYRVDFMALHCYWYKSTAQWASDLQYIYDKYKRPIWITEWNIGANWTGNSFPDGSVKLTDANATKHKNDLIAILNVLDNADYVERYSIYNWVEDSRAMTVTIDAGFMNRNPDYENYQWLKTAPVISTKQGPLPDGSTGTINTVLTPAGEYYAANASKKAYNPSREFIPKWKPKDETLSYELAPDNNSITVNWTGINDDLVGKYVVVRRLEGELNFSVFYETTDFATTSFQDDIHTKAEYRIRTIDKEGVSTSYSPILTFIQSEIPTAPTNLVGEALSASRIKLDWSVVSNANNYNIKRSTTVDGVYEVIASNIADVTYQDTGLDVNATYFYKISASNSGGESPDSNSIELTTLNLSIPDMVSNIKIASGDAQVKLEWSPIYDVEFYVKRATSETGPFNIIATIATNTYEDLTVSNGVAYYYTISAFNAQGEGSDSDIIISKPNLGQHAYYDFEENGTLSAHDQWGNYSAVLSASTTWTQGKIGNAAVNLNGGSSSFIQLEDGIMENLNDFTISTWIKPTTSSTWARVFDFGMDTNSNMFLTTKNGSDGKFRFAIKSNDGAEQRINTTIAPTNGDWTHVAVTLNNSVGILYIDGVEVGRNDAITITPSTLGKTIKNYIGKSQWPDPYFNGAIDDFKIYNRALSSTEIESLVSTLGIDETVLSDESKYSFYSVDHSLNVISNASEDSNYRIYSITGKLLSAGKILSRGISNLGTYLTGIYIVHLENADEVNTVKVLVK